MERNAPVNAERLSWVSMILSLIAVMPGYLYAGQESQLTPLSGINQAWLDETTGASSWGRNPFFFPRGDSRSSLIAETTYDAGELQLSAILYHEGGSVAIINHRIVRQGDLIGGRKVASILEDRVIIQDLNGMTVLKLDPFGAK
jgi:hypothetical protein